MRLSRRGVLLAGAFGAACAGRRGLRCAHCGMRVDARSPWRAGALDARGGAVDFDTPGCLLRYRLAHAVTGAWVVERYAPATQRTEVARVRFALGSDVLGPMGADFVPVAPEHEEGFARDHRPARWLRWDEVDEAALRGVR